MRYWRCAWAFRERRRPTKQQSLPSPPPCKAASTIPHSKDSNLRSNGQEVVEADSDSLALRRCNSHPERRNAAPREDKRDRCSTIAAAAAAAHHTTAGRHKDAAAFSSWMRTGIFSFGTHRNVKRLCGSNNERINAEDSFCEVEDIEHSALLRDQPIRNNSSFFIDNGLQDSYALGVTLDAGKVAQQAPLLNAADDGWETQHPEAPEPSHGAGNPQPKRKSLRRLSALSFRALKLARLMGFRAPPSGGPDPENPHHHDAPVPENTRGMSLAAPHLLRKESRGTFQSGLAGPSGRDTYLLSSSASSLAVAETARRKRKKKKSVHFTPLAPEASDGLQVHGGLGALFNRQNSVRNQQVIVAVLEFDADKPVQCISGQMGAASSPSDGLEEGLGLPSFSALRKSSRRTKSRPPVLSSSAKYKIFRDTAYDEDTTFWTPFDLLTPEYEGGGPYTDGALPCGFYVYNAPAGIDQAYELSKLNASSMYHKVQPRNSSSESSTQDPVTTAAAIAAQYRKHVAHTALRFAAQRGRSRCMSVPPEVYRTDSWSAPVEQRRRSSVPTLIPHPTPDHAEEGCWSGSLLALDRRNRGRPAAAPETSPRRRPAAVVQNMKGSQSSVTQEPCCAASPSNATEPWTKTRSFSQRTLCPTASLSAVVPNDRPILCSSAPSGSQRIATRSSPASVSLSTPPRALPARKKDSETTRVSQAAHSRNVACGCCSWPARNLSGNCAAALAHTPEKATVPTTEPSSDKKGRGQGDRTGDRSTPPPQMQMASAAPPPRPPNSTSIRPAGPALRFLESPLSAELCLGSRLNSQKRVATGEPGSLSHSTSLLRDGTRDPHPSKPLSHPASSPLSRLTSPLAPSSPRSCPAVRL